MTRPIPRARSDFAHFQTLTTRWMDNDVYGHVNNVTYYSYFDTVVNHYLIQAGALNIESGDVIGLVVNTGCHYFAPVTFPQQLEAGVVVTHMGTSSVRYEVGVFIQGETSTAAHGHFVHVYVDKATRRPVPLPNALHKALLHIYRQTQNKNAD